jgi:hypothetical protein
LKEGEMSVTRPKANATEVYAVTDMSESRIKIFFNRKAAEMFAEECKDRLPGYKIPEVVQIYDKLGEGEDGEDVWDPEDSIEWYANGDGVLKTLNSLMKR